MTSTGRQRISSDKSEDVTTTTRAPAVDEIHGQEIPDQRFRSSHAQRPQSSNLNTIVIILLLFGLVLSVIVGIGIVHYQHLQHQMSEQNRANLENQEKLNKIIQAVLEENKQVRQEAKAEKEKRIAQGEMVIKQNQLNEAGFKFLQECIQTSDKFTGVRLLWGLIEIGYTSKELLNVCMLTYNQRFQQRQRIIYEGYDDEL